MKDELLDDPILPIEGVGKFVVASTPTFCYQSDRASKIIRAFAIPKDVLDADQHGSYTIAKHHEEMTRRKIVDAIIALCLCEIDIRRKRHKIYGV